MPITIDPICSDILSIESFIEHVEDHGSTDSIERLAESASQFKALANDKDLIPKYFNNEIKRFLNNGSFSAYTPQSVILGSGRGFYLRANIWIPLKLNGSFRTQEEKVFSYRSTHDHNFTFMTVGYHGPGYETELYQYDPSKVKGYVEEIVDLNYIGRTRLPVGRVMIYREKADVHTQFPPDELSVSINLMVQKSRKKDPDQYFFDPATGRIIGMAPFAHVHKRASIIALAGQLANANTIDIISSLVESAPCRRVREAAITAISSLAGISDKEKYHILEKGASDHDIVVREHARSLLQSKCG